MNEVCTFLCQKRTKIGSTEKVEIGEYMQGNYNIYAKNLAELGNAPQYDTLMMQIIAWLCNIFMQEVLVQPPRIGISAYKPLILGSF